LIGSSGDFRFSKSANWFILPPETTDNRSGGVWAARMNVNAPYRFVPFRATPRIAVPHRPPFQLQPLPGFTTGLLSLAISF